VKRTLQGSLGNLSPDTICRILSAASASGHLEITTEAGAMRLDVYGGRVPVANDDELATASAVFQSSEGSFIFEPAEVEAITGVSLTLSAYAAAAQAFGRRQRSSFPSEVDLDHLLRGDLIDFSEDEPRPNIHVLGSQPPENPLDDLLAELEATAPEELLLTQVGVVTSDPRVWRGRLEVGWRRRGWRLHVCALPEEAPVDQLDVLVVHHGMSITRVGHEHEWTTLIRTAAAHVPPIPVVWTGPLGDPSWIHQLIDAGATFLLPPPQGHSGETFRRFADSLTTVVERQVATSRLREPETSPVSELMDAVLHEVDSEQGLSSLLQLVSGHLPRGAVLRVETMAFSCWAGFGYPLSHGSTALPRGVGLLERVVRRRQPLVGLDPEAGGARQLARVLGLDSLPAATAIVPLGVGNTVGGVLVADREGEPLPDLDQLLILITRLGGIVLQGEHPKP
jgi:hypothetical protein